MIVEKKLWEKVMLSGYLQMSVLRRQTGINGVVMVKDEEEGLSCVMCQKLFVVSVGVWRRCEDRALVFGQHMDMTEHSEIVRQNLSSVYMKRSTFAKTYQCLCEGSGAG